MGARAPDEPLVEGRVVIAASVPSLDRAAVHVRLEDVSDADAASRLMAETVVRDVRHDGVSDTAIPFALRGEPAIDPRRDYAVRVWVDRDGDNVPSRGDLHSDQRHPVLTRGFGRTVEIILGATGEKTSNLESQP